VGILSTVAETQVPTWVTVIDELALQALRTHVQIEFDLRAVLRSEGPPGDVLERAARILQLGMEESKSGLLMARALLLLHRFDLDVERRKRLAEQICGMHLLLLARLSGWTCVGYFRQRGEWEALEASRIVAGLVPQVFELESETATLFVDPPSGEGIPTA
jgi:hypothetical protein